VARYRRDAPRPGEAPASPGPPRLPAPPINIGMWRTGLRHDLREPAFDPLDARVERSPPAMWVVPWSYRKVVVILFRTTRAKAEDQPSRR